MSILSKNLDSSDILSICCAYLQGISCSLVAIFLTTTFPSIEGSGIPETKSVVAGTSIYKYMNLPIQLIKILALVLAIASGFIVGKVGPFVHLSVCLANSLSKL